ncbi:MAG: phosphoribosylamine--glycine ligase [Flavobacteriales bacterium]
MAKEKFLIVGSGGRESAFALKLYQETQLFALMGHNNPTIIDCVNASGGEFLVANANDPKVVLAYAQNHQIDYVFVSADDPLANGVVDILLENKIKAVGGTQAATRIEWDKIYSIDLMHAVAPERTPFYRVVNKTDNLDEAISAFKAKGVDLVVKPQGLTGGKGVKVMPDHLANFEECKAYTQELLEAAPDESVLLVEKLEGIEFTIMGLTDGENLVMAPATYDYPFRFEGDTGPGTGGMGCFTNNEKKLPFMTDADLESCRDILQRVIDEMRARNLVFNGVLNGGFFKTADGIKFMEFNSRFGDPEGLNVLSVLESSFAELIKSMYYKTLKDSEVKFANKASVIKYIVAKDYPKHSAETTVFELNPETYKAEGVDIIFGSCERVEGHQYTSLKKSRVLAFCACADDIETASERINQSIESHFKTNLDYRKDVASTESLQKLEAINRSLV